MDTTAPANELERRKQVRIRLRCDLAIAPQKYEGRTYYVVKDPVSLRYYRFKEQEHFLIRLMNGTTTLDDAQKSFEKRFRPERLTLEDLEGFAQQLISAGLAQNESPNAGKQLYDQRKKRRRSEIMQALTNILYIKIPVYDPDRLLVYMLNYTRWMFSITFLAVSVAVMLGAVLLVATHFEIFREKLPSYQEFFSFKTVAYLWVALGVVKVIHEFGHGLSCKAFGGEVHEMGLLFLVLSPCLYCNVSDAWTLPSKWKRIIISGAGIYVELIIAAIATFVWWNSASHPFVHNLSLSLMIVCSVSTVVFNANPLMRYDGYYVLADWLEIPNLRDRSNRYLKNLTLEYCLGVEVQPEQYMERSRKVLFVAYAIVSYIYRWVVTYSILYWMSSFLKPYKLEIVSQMLAVGALGSMLGWPMYRMGKNLNKRGRLPDMKAPRVTMTAIAVAILILFFFLVPLPVSRVRQTALIQVHPDAQVQVFAPRDLPTTGGAILKQLYVRDGDTVSEGQILAEFTSRELDAQLSGARTQVLSSRTELDQYQKQYSDARDAQAREKINVSITRAESELKGAQTEVESLEAKQEKLTLKAPRDGVVMNPPQIDDIGKLWDEQAQNQAFCSVGDAHALRVWMPVSPSDYNLLQEDLMKSKKNGKELTVTLRVQGRAEKLWHGKLVTPLSPQEATKLPPQLSSKFGGPIAIKPGGEQNQQYVPQSQQYLVFVDIIDPDNAIAPGTLAQAKINCQYRTCAWWVWRTVSNTFDLGLM
jgi:putative peptide zinc metalloprotease protein